MTGNLSVLRYINFVFLALILRPTILAFSSNFLVYRSTWRKPPSSSLNLQIEEEHIDNFNNETLSLKLPMQGV